MEQSEIDRHNLTASIPGGLIVQGVDAIGRLRNYGKGLPVIRNQLRKMRDDAALHRETRAAARALLKAL